jgi:hypothetical protein
MVVRRSTTTSNITVDFSITIVIATALSALASAKTERRDVNTLLEYN